MFLSHIVFTRAARSRRAGISRHRMSVCLSVCLSHAGIVSKRQGCSYIKFTVEYASEKIYTITHQEMR